MQLIEPPIIAPSVHLRRSAERAHSTTALGGDLYWQIGEHISRQLSADGWGHRTVKELAHYIQRRQPNAQGFSASNLWRMMQFFEIYRDSPKLAPLVRELS